MEEDIKILEEIIETYRSCSVDEEGFDMVVDIGFMKKECKALENLLTRYKEYEKALDNFMRGKAFSTKQLDKIEEDTLDIKRENYKLRKENFELMQDNVKIQEEINLLKCRLKEAIIKGAKNV